MGGVLLGVGGPVDGIDLRHLYTPVFGRRTALGDAQEHRALVLRNLHMGRVLHHARRNDAAMRCGER